MQRLTHPVRYIVKCLFTVNRNFELTEWTARKLHAMNEHTVTVIVRFLVELEMLVRLRTGQRDGRRRAYFLFPYHAYNNMHIQ